MAVKSLPAGFCKVFEFHPK